MSSSSSPADPRDPKHDDAAHAAPEYERDDAPAECPICDRCGTTMSYLGRIPPGRLSAGKVIFRCYNCNRVVSQ